MKTFDYFKFFFLLNLSFMKIPPNLQIKPKIGGYSKKLREA